MKTKSLLLIVSLVLACSFEASAQLAWSSYNTSGTRVSTSAASYDSATSSYTFTIPANTTYTFVTTNFAPVTLAASQTKTVTFTMTASGGFGPVGSPVINKRFIAYGLFNYGATAPAATGSFTDDLGLWTDSYQQTSGIAAEVFGGVSTTANLLTYASTRQIGAAVGPSTGAVGQFTDGSATNVTFRVVENASGTASIGTGTNTSTAGAWYQDAATSGTTFNRTIYSAGATTPNGTTTFNEFAFMFFNSTASSVTLTLKNIVGVTPPPIITTQPEASTTATEAGNLTLSVVATGATSYQWQKSTDGGSNFTPISGNATATTASLTLTNVTMADAAIYNVVVTNAAGSVTSTNSTVTVTTGMTPPSISTHPSGATVLVGGSASFSVTANGTAPLSYQWQKSTDGGSNYGDISGATNAGYSISGVVLGDAGHYRVNVTNSAGNATSNAAVLTVQEAPAITTQPVGGTIATGANHTISVAATGTPVPTYQWKLNSVNIAGATSAGYTINNASGPNAGYYSCVITNAAGTVTTNSVYVGVLSVAMSLSSVTPINGATGLNRDVPLKITFNQPVSVGNAGRIRVYDAASPGTPVDTIDMSTAITVTQFGTPYRYMAKTISGVNFNYMPITVSGNTATIALHSSTALAYGKTYYVNIEPGVLLDATGATFGGISDNSTWSFSTKAAGSAVNATSITVAADGSGDFDTVQGAVDFVPYSPANTIPRTITIANGTYNEIVRLRSGQNLVTMQGQSRAGTVIQYLTNNNSLISGANSIGQRSVFGADPNDFTIQNLTIRNSTPNGGSQAEAFWVGNNAQRMTIYALNLLSYQDTFMNNGGQAFVTDCYIEGNVDFIWGSGKTFFNNCELKMVGLASGGIYVQARNSPSTFPGYFFSNCQLTKDASVTANSTYFARIDPGAYPYSQVVWMNCRMDTHIIASGWQLNNATTAPNIKYWEYQSVALDGTTPVNVNGRPTYNNNATGVGGSSVLANQQIDTPTATFFSDAVNAIGWAPRPAIGTQPASQNINAGQSVTLSVAATSPLAMTYQWFKDTVAISGATAATYTIANPLPSNAGSYTVVVTNPAGSTTSNAAVLNVVDVTPPVITAHANVTAEATSAAGAVVTYDPASANDDVGVTSLTYSQDSGTTFPIGSTTVTITAKDAANNTGTGTFTVTVQDTTAPVVTPPANITAAARSSLGATVTFGGASASDAVGVTSVTYTPASGSTLPIGTTTVTVTARDAANNAGTGSFTVTVTPLTPVQSWREQYFGTTASTGDAADNADPDHDGISNMIEFAFGTDPTSGASGPPALQFTGTFTGGGTLDVTGQPMIMFESPGSGIDFRALFIRRADYAAAGLTYTVEFSASMNTWAPGAAEPAVLATDGDLQVVSVPYLPFVGGKKARFFRVHVVLSP